MLISWQVFSSRFAIGLSRRPFDSSGYAERKAATNAVVSAAVGSSLRAGAAEGDDAAAEAVGACVTTAVELAAGDVVAGADSLPSSELLHPATRIAAATAIAPEAVREILT